MNQSQNLNNVALEQLALLYEQITLAQSKYLALVETRNVPGPEPIYPDVILVKNAVNSARKTVNSLTNIITNLETQYVGSIVRLASHHEQEHPESSLRGLDSECELWPNGLTVFQYESQRDFISKF